MCMIFRKQCVDKTDDCGDQQILQPGPGEIRQYYYIYSPVCSRLFNRIQLHIPQLLYW